MEDGYLEGNSNNKVKKKSRWQGEEKESKRSHQVNNSQTGQHCI